VAVALRHLAWYARATVARAIRERKPDVILTSGPPHVVHFLGWDAKKRFRLPWVVDCRDPWVTTSDVRPPTGMKAVYERFWERRVFARADAIVTNAPHAREKTGRGAARATPPASTPSPTATTRTSSPPRRPAPPARSASSTPAKLYAGRDPRPILDAVAGIVPGSVPPFRFEFLGRTEYAKGADLAAEARLRGLSESIVCRGQVTYRQTLDEMAGADVLLLMDTLNRHIGVPAKLYEYLGAGRPVLATGESGGDLAAVLGQSGVPFRIARPDDPAAIRSAVVDLVNGVANHSLPPVCDDSRLRFTREALAGRLARLFDSLRGARS